MARAYGIRAAMLGQYESAYGTAPGGNYMRLPFVQSNLGAEQGLIEDDLLGAGRDPADPIRDAISNTGEITVPVDLRDIGFWLKLAFGQPATDEPETDEFVHTFSSGSFDLPSAAIEIGHPEVPAYFVHTGVRANGINFTFERRGGASAVVPCIAQGETQAGTSSGGTPTERVHTRFNQFQGSVSLGGSPLGNVTRATANYANNLEVIETIRPDGLIGGADPVRSAMTGTFDVRFADTALLDAATAGDPVDLAFAWTIAEVGSLTIAVPRVFLPKPKTPVTGPGGIQASFDWRGARDGTDPMVTVTLANDVATY
ncbi:MAG: phage tail tube protein [Alphaproteobacteria bacterium]